jgi:hypothetical protein
MAVVLVVRIPCCSIQRLDSEVNVKNRIDNQRQMILFLYSLTSVI